MKLFILTVMFHETFSQTLLSKGYWWNCIIYFHFSAASIHAITKSGQHRPWLKSFTSQSNGADSSQTLSNVSINQDRGNNGLFKWYMQPKHWRYQKKTKSWKITIKYWGLKRNTFTLNHFHKVEEIQAKTLKYSWFYQASDYRVKEKFKYWI